MNLVIEKIKGLFEKKDAAPKAHVQIVLRGLLQDEIYLLQNLTQSWHIPGRMTTASARVVVIELEGPETQLQEKIEEIKIYPQLMRRTMVVKYSPYTGDYKHFSVVFASC